MIIDVTRTFQNVWLGKIPTGIDRVDIEYVRHFNSSAKALVRLGPRWIFINKCCSQKLFKILLFEGGNMWFRLNWLIIKEFLFNWNLPVTDELLLNTSHIGLERKAYPSRIKRYGLRPIYFLHDLIPILYNEYCSPKATIKHHNRLKTILETADAVLVNSKETGYSLDQYAIQKGQKPPPWTVVALGPGRLKVHTGSPPLSHPYFVVLSTIEPRKNHLLLLNVWRELVEQLGESAPRLVVIGRRGWECEQVLDMLERCITLRGFVIELPNCNDHKLVAWLTHARALLFPSFIEGYGLPLVETLALGVPAIVSSINIFREIAGNVPEYISPIDGLGWKNQILEYTKTNSVSRKLQIKRIMKYKVPTWKEHFKIVENLLISQFNKID
jgi:glycosyltransferase involved in cell wall biosynthesis